MWTTNFNTPNHLSLEQMEELQQFGPFHTADASLTVLYQEEDDGYHEYACLDRHDTMTDRIISIVKEKENVQQYDSYSLNDLLNKLPHLLTIRDRTYELIIDMAQYTVAYGYAGEGPYHGMPLYDEYTNNGNIIDAVYKMFIRILKLHPEEIKYLLYNV